MQDPLNYALDEEAIACAAQLERLRVFNERCIFGAVSSLAGIALLAWVIWASAGWASAVPWALLMGLVESAIFLAGLRCRRALADNARTEFWLKVHTALAALAGIAWGSAAWFVWQESDVQFYLATLTILVGVAGVSMVTMASYALATLLFFSGIYLMPLTHVALHGSQVATFGVVSLVVGLVV